MALDIKVSSSDWIDLRTRGYTSEMYLLNAVGAAIEYSTAATPVPGTTLVGSSAVLISGTYLWVRGSGDCELYTASEWAAANVKTVPVMASTSSSGGVEKIGAGDKYFDISVDTRPVVCIGGDHPYKQYWGRNGNDGLAQMYAEHGIVPYLALNTRSLTAESVGSQYFMGWDKIQSLTNDGKILSLSWWRDEEAIRNWKQNVFHQAAQAEGRESIFSDYRNRE